MSEKPTTWLHVPEERAKAVKAAHARARQFEYWVAENPMGSTPLWRGVRLHDGLHREACSVEEGKWLDDFDTGELGDGWRKVSFEEAFALYPTAWPILMLDDLTALRLDAERRGKG